MISLFLSKVKIQKEPFIKALLGWLVERCLPTGQAGWNLG